MREYFGNNCAGYSPHGTVPTPFISAQGNCMFTCLPRNLGKMPILMILEKDGLKPLVYLEDHPMTCKWLISMVSCCPLNGVVPFPNGLNCL